nr:putative pentatricopeptide repeat-containing protein [Quercus suber]
MFFQHHFLHSELSKIFQSLSRTKQLHALIIRTHLSCDPFYATRIVRFYAINNDIHSAHNLFNKTPQRSVFLWNSIIRAYAQAQNFCEAQSLFKMMLRTETRPDCFTYACIIRACSENFNLGALRLVHGGVIVSGLGLDSICGSAFVTAYSKLGLVDEASVVFHGIPEPDLVMWNSMISGYGCHGFWDKGLQLFSRMRNEGTQPDGYTIVGLLSGLAYSSLLSIGQGIHGFCLKSGFDFNAHVGSVLVSMYSRFKCMNSAYRVFSNLSQLDLVTWSALITGYSQSGDYEKALFFFKKLNMQGKMADPILIASVLAAVAQFANVVPGCEIHGYVLRHGFESDVMACNPKGSGCSQSPIPDGSSALVCLIPLESSFGRTLHFQVEFLLAPGQFLPQESLKDVIQNYEELSYRELCSTNAESLALGCDMRSERHMTDSFHGSFSCIHPQPVVPDCLSNVLPSCPIQRDR